MENGVATIVLFLFGGLYLQAQAVQSVECANMSEAQTEPHRGKHNTTVALQIHTEDDHSKETHLCMSHYSFLVTVADDPPVRREVISIDDSYGRPIQFWIDGFAPGGHRVIATIVDEDYNLVTYDPRTDTVSTMTISQAFLNRLSAACRKTLAVSGVTQDNYVVISTGGDGCGSPKKRWKVKPGPVVDGIQKHALLEQLPDTAVVEAME